MRFPLSLLDEPLRFMKWQEQAGPTEAKRQIEIATRAEMAEHGNRVVLEIGAKMEAAENAMEDQRAVLREFIV